MKKNIIKIPKDIYTQIKTMDSTEIVAGCAVKFKTEEILAGKLAHLGISVDTQGLHLPDSIIPLKSQGKYSDRNLNGQVIVRKDLPKETHYNSIESPNWGDVYYGTHTVNLPFKKFPRDFNPPRELEILMTCSNTQPNLSSYIIAFQVKEVLDIRSKDFEEKLLEDLNLLQENIGKYGVHPANVPIIDYMKSLHVSWEILPPGTLEETINRVFRGKSPTTEQKDVTTERYKFFMGLKPKEFIFGQSGFRRYLGALLDDDLVIFENIEYGNAIYILFNNWEELSKLSRINLLSGKFGENFERVIHTNEWKSRVESIIAEQRNLK